MRSGTGSKRTKTSEHRGEVLDVVRSLLSEGQEDAVVSLFERLVARNSELELRLAQLLSRARKNEGVSSAQLKLFLEKAAEAGAAGEDAASPNEIDAADEKLRNASGIDERVERERTIPEPPKQPPVRQPAPAHLERRANPILVPDAERPCPQCGAERKCIGHDRTEVIELEPAKVYVRVDVREKLACEDCEGEIVRAPPGDKVVSGGRLGTRLVAELLVDKYHDGLSLHRIKQRLSRMTLELPISTLADQVTWSTDLLEPLWRLAIDIVLRSEVMHLDATSLPVLDREAAGGKRVGALWGYVGDEHTAAYLYASTAKKTAQKPGELGPEEMLAKRSGLTVADASNLFDKSFQRDDLIECGCNMHARRYFVKALDSGDKRAALALAAYKKLYEIEAEIRDRSPEDKLAVRQQRSKPVFDELVSWAKTRQPHEPPSSPLGVAIRYLLNHRQALGRFLEYGAVPMDNGVVERLHVRTALTRKNYLFAGSDAGGKRAAIAYTILACCRLAGANPVEYLADVLPRLARRVRIRELPALMPIAWKALRESHATVETDAPSPDPSCRTTTSRLGIKS